MWLTRATTQSACNSAPVQLTVPATDDSIPAAPAGRLSEAVRKLHVQRGQPEEKIPVPAMQTDVGSTFPVSQRNGPEVLGVNCVPLHSVPPWMRATAAGRAWKAAQDMSPSKVQVLAIDGVKVEQEAGGLRHASMAGVGASRDPQSSARPLSSRLVPASRRLRHPSRRVCRVVLVARWVVRCPWGPPISLT